MNNKKGFTLIEMLVVIAITAVLVAIIVPTISSATKKAKAAVDAANLRSILGVANAILADDTPDKAAAFAQSTEFECATFPDAEAVIAYKEPGFVQAFFKDGEKYYSYLYFADIADTGTSSRLDESPEVGSTVYTVGSKAAE